MDTMTDNLLNEQVNKKEIGISLQYEANFINNHSRSENYQINKGCNGGYKSHPKLVCYYCGKPRDKKSNCRYYKKDQKAGKLGQIRLETRKKTKLLLS